MIGAPHILVLAASLLGAGGFDELQAQYRDASPGARAELARAFIERQQAHGGFPIVEPGGSVVFLYAGTGAEKSVAVIGDFKTKSFNSVYWDEAGQVMERLAPGSPVFWKRMKFEHDARLDYQLAVDGKFMPDPLNAHSIVSGAAPSKGGDGEIASELTMPAFVPSSALAERMGAAKGRLVIVDEAWATPKVTIYLPPGYDPAARVDYPVVYTADGRQWRDFIRLPTILDNVIADEAVAPLIAVMIDAGKDRGDWYQFNPAYLAYLAKVVDYVDAHYPTRRDPAARLHAGSSAGGRASLQVGLQRPDLFANLAMFSPSLFSPPHHYEPLLSGRKRPDRRLRVWMSAGSYEGYIEADTRLFERVLRKARVRVTSKYTHEGHSFGTTRHLVPDMLAHFFPARHAGR